MLQLRVHMLQLKTPHVTTKIPLSTRETRTAKYTHSDFPGSTVATNPSANAGDMRSILVREDPRCHARQLSPCTTTSEPMLHSERSCHSEKPGRCSQEWPLPRHN